MTTLFGKKYRLIVGESGGNGKQWEELNVRFKITKTGDASANEAEIEIYNLSLESRNFLSKGDQAIILEAGYKDNFGRIFAGYTTFTKSTKGFSRKDDQIRSGFERHKKSDADWVTKITAHDGLKALKHYVSLSLSDEKLTELGVLKKVINKLNESVKVTAGTLKGVKETKINHGRVVSGIFRDILNRICTNQKLDWSITDGVLNIYPKGDVASGQIILVDATSGLIGSPEPTEKGYKFSLLMRHEINPGTLVELDSKLIKGQFTVTNVEHVGELDGTSWNTTVEAMPKVIK